MGKEERKLTYEERLLVNSELQRRGKSQVVAYLLLLTCGLFGIHRFYLGDKNTAIIQLVLAILGYVTAFIVIGFFLLLGVGIWVIIDAFKFVPQAIKENHDALEKQIIRELDS